MAPIHPQFITAGDEQLVVITRAEFDLLMVIAGREDREEADDIAVFDGRMAELEVGTDARAVMHLTTPSIESMVSPWTASTHRSRAARTPKGI